MAQGLAWALDVAFDARGDAHRTLQHVHGAEPLELLPIGEGMLAHNRRA